MVVSPSRTCALRPRPNPFFRTTQRGKVPFPLFRLLTFREGEPPVSRFPGVDFLEIDALLSEEERMARDTVREFVDDQVKPIIEECHREGRTPLELVPEMGRMNLFGATLTD